MSDLQKKIDELKGRFNLEAHAFIDGLNVQLTSAAIDELEKEIKEWIYAQLDKIFGEIIAEKLMSRNVVNKYSRKARRWLRRAWRKIF